MVQAFRRGGDLKFSESVKNQVKKAKFQVKTQNFIYRPI